MTRINIFFQDDMMKVLLGTALITYPLIAVYNDAGHRNAVTLDEKGKGELIVRHSASAPIEIQVFDSAEPPLFIFRANIRAYAVAGDHITIDLSSIKID